MAQEVAGGRMKDPSPRRRVDSPWRNWLCDEWVEVPTWYATLVWSWVMCIPSLLVFLFLPNWIGLIVWAGVTFILALVCGTSTHRYYVRHCLDGLWRK